MRWLPVAAAPSIPAGRVQRINLRAQMLWTARFRVLWIVLGFVLLMLIALVRIASLGLVGHAPERNQSLQDALLPPRGEYYRSQRRAAGARLSCLCAMVRSFRDGR